MFGKFDHCNVITYKYNFTLHKLYQGINKFEHVQNVKQDQDHTNVTQIEQIDFPLLPLSQNQLPSSQLTSCSFSQPISKVPTC
jgi:hypothetical protein